MNAIVSRTQIDFQTFNIQHDTAEMLGIHGGLALRAVVGSIKRHLTDTHFPYQSQ
jgi:hypothetical protein